ncbi:hypothetical protein PHSY_002466 [Pseudozyma hubeiensis SY62]|uniref:Uncharacterized protein n=1 Tax=Pseudozyma hubeiensis (strain SY62) TaxID=1305764 RepID=R9P0X7_PSEHS|nr:hypothetical protein PHSY_002466 [Pseudozyma hubeiensis SY62]GAC94893.1 hypothetical protein PHSY_002466 [Pseudozyma hubeiensis SY62]
MKSAAHEPIRFIMTCIRRSYSEPPSSFFHGPVHEPVGERRDKPPIRFIQQKQRCGNAYRGSGKRGCCGSFISSIFATEVWLLLFVQHFLALVVAPQQPLSEDHDLPGPHQQNLSATQLATTLVSIRPVTSLSAKSGQADCSHLNSSMPGPSNTFEGTERSA